MKTKLKICGITREEEIPFINEVHPDYIGFVFAESKRKIDKERAMCLSNMLERDIRRVGVFVDESPDRIVSLLEEDVIDIAQLHGNEDEETIRYIRERSGKPFIKAFILKNVTDNKEHASSDGNINYNGNIIYNEDINCENSNYIRCINDCTADYVLIDSGKGSGKTFDWSVTERIARPFFLAGGITPENVAEAVSKVGPYCIDVSSGVERNGMKDAELMRMLVREIRLSL